MIDEVLLADCNVPFKIFEKYKDLETKIQK